MNINLYIANKIRKGKITGKKIAGPVITIATLGIILGVTVMILSLTIGTGFKREIRNKIVGFGSHIQIINYDYNSSFETNPIRKDSIFVKEIYEFEGIKHIQEFATKPGLIKTKDNIQGIILKGTGSDYDWSYLESTITEGKLPNYNTSKTSNEIIISNTIAKLLQLNIGDKVPMYFFQDKIRARNFRIAAIYDTHLAEFDKMFMFVDIRQIVKLNNWNNNQITGYEITLNSFDQLEELSREIDILAASRISPDGGMLRISNIQQQQPQIFGWLGLLDMNVAVIITLIVIVAGFNMISGLLIIILERTSMIGILKSIGTQNWNIRKIFLYLGSFIIIRGVLIGNIIGLTLCLIQQQFGLFKLNPENYYLDTVPIYINALHIVYLNIGTLLVSYLMMVGPSYLITKITPVEAIRFD
ncbi:ABC transporter permease [Saccharicrinis aurantiacus]|uniref:ABC transporter permease n=1 Tax=Saccharicrinis aurantiacus TaxID=1849719 RepID=UPI002493B047|nr:FtsX-like permease family protein [Saccharicrinis aurantiacus]